MTQAFPQPGDFFVTEYRGTEWRAQLMSYAIQWGTASHVNHAGIYIGDGQVIEARPGGAGYAPAAGYLGSNTKWSSLPVLASQAEAIVAAAIEHIGTPYGWLDAVAIAVAQRRLGGHLDTTKPIEQQPWWYRRIGRADRLICSQLVDLAYYEAGIHLFDDGRAFGLVSPGDLENIIDEGHTL